MKMWIHRVAMYGSIVVASVVTGLFATNRLTGADHIDAPITTNDADADINDLFVFVSPNDPSMVVFGLTMRPLIPPSEAITVQFPTDVLYQWRIDTNGDDVEDMVLQARVVDDDGTPTLVVRGPSFPAATGRESMELSEDPLVSGPVSSANQTLILQGSNGVRAFAGVRDDPFYIDLTQLLAVLAGQESSFRNPGEDTLAGLNTLGIIVEMPITMLRGATQIGVWATSSRAL